MGFMVAGGNSAPGNPDIDPDAWFAISLDGKDGKPMTIVEKAAMAAWRASK